MSGIRPYRVGDEAALYDICVRTAANGADARGVMPDDRLWGDVFAVPYAVRDPALTFVVVSDEDAAIGYILGTDDTAAFGAWFRENWWPQHRPTEEAGPQEWLVRFGDRVGEEGAAAPAGYPAELHIDLLPDAQGAGWGRRLMETFFAALRERGVPGVHLGVSKANGGAVAFYERLGFTRVSESDDTIVFGMAL